MSWLGAILTALVLAVGGTFLGGFMATRAADWLKVSTREGKAGYFVVLMGLLAGLYSLVAGLLVARYGGFESGALAFACAAGVAAGGILLVAGLSWLLADRPPALAGRGLVLDLEIRAPAGGAAIPSESRGFYAYLSAHGAGMAMADLDFARLGQVEGRWVLPASVELHTRRPQLYIGLGGERLAGATVFFHPRLEPPLRAHLGQWSAWLAGSPAGGGADSDAAGFEVRVRLREDRPPGQEPGQDQPGPA